MIGGKSGRRWISAIGTIGLVVVATACSIDPEGTPRNIAVKDQGDLQSTPDQAAGPSTGSGRIYLLSPEVPGQPRTLRSVARELQDAPADAMRALFEGPNTDELKELLRTAIPPGTRLLDVTRNGSELIVNVSEELQQLTSEALVDGVAQIVLTASDISGVSSVSIEIDGVPQEWPAVSGELRSEALTPYDFPGLVLSSQPAFPSVPSPQQPTP